MQRGAVRDIDGPDQLWRMMAVGGIVKSGNTAHDTACLAAEVTRQNAVSGSPTQAIVNAAEITYHRAVISSAKLNLGGSGIEASLSALRTLGVNS